MIVLFRNGQRLHIAEAREYRLEDGALHFYGKRGRWLCAVRVDAVAAHFYDNEAIDEFGFGKAA